MVPGGSSDTGQQQLEVVACGARIAVLLGDGFALLGQADGSPQRPRWQCFQKTVRGSRPTADGAAPAMKELHLHPSLFTDLGQTSLAALQGPLAGHNAGILVRIRVAHHHLLQQPARTSGPKRMVGKTGSGHREF